jgi:peptidoglycan/LPS O-acetylase OafA/YrhL
MSAYSESVTGQRQATAPADPAFVAFRARSRFGSLDGLRALSVAAVIWSHTGGPVVELAQHGHHGVTLFFAISGFLITTLLLREKDQHGAIDLRAFYVRRTLRIFPLYYAVLLTYVVAVFALERDSEVGQAFFSNLSYFATYTSNWFVALDGRVIFYFAWSLAAEEQFYLFWPPLLERLGSRVRALAVAASVVVLSAWIEFALPWFVGADQAQAAQALLHKIPLAIVAGVVGALVLHDREAFVRWWPWLAGSRWHSLAWLVIALAVTLHPASPWAASHLALTALVLACCMREDHVLARLLRLRPLAYLGTISYGLYLLHMLCMNAIVMAAGHAGIDLGLGALFAATLLLTTAVAGASFAYFESPLLRLKKRFERTSPAGRQPA